MSFFVIYSSPLSKISFYNLLSLCVQNDGLPSADQLQAADVVTLFINNS